jgi:hypothetical protein
VLINQIGASSAAAANGCADGVLLLARTRPRVVCGRRTHQLAAIGRVHPHRHLLAAATVWSTDPTCAAAIRTTNAVWGNAASVLVGDFFFLYFPRARSSSWSNSDALRAVKSSPTPPARSPKAKCHNCCYPTIPIPTKPLVSCRVIERKTAVIFRRHATRRG